MFSFGEFFSLEGEESNYSVWELSLFIIIGCMGGVIGALFNYVNTRIFNFREMYTRTPRLRLIEVLVLTAVYTILAYFLPL
jgi:H+/Cl- antiporter ClcA